MRCPDCNKFVSYEDPPEVEESGDPEISFDKEGTVTGSVRVVLKCADCGTELKDADLDYEETFQHKCTGKEVGEWEAEFDSAEGSSRLENKDRRGRPISSTRYMKTFYGADVMIKATCPRCGEEVMIETHVEEQASSFNECC